MHLKRTPSRLVGLQCNPYFYYGCISYGKISALFLISTFLQFRANEEGRTRKKIGVASVAL